MQLASKAAAASEVSRSLGTSTIRKTKPVPADLAAGSWVAFFDCGLIKCTSHPLPVNRSFIQSVKFGTFYGGLLIETPVSAL